MEQLSPGRLRRVRVWHSGWAGAACPEGLERLGHACAATGPYGATQGPDGPAHTGAPRWPRPCSRRWCRAGPRLGTGLLRRGTGSGCPACSVPSRRCQPGARPRPLDGPARVPTGRVLAAGPRRPHSSSRWPGEDGGQREQRGRDAVGTRSRPRRPAAPSPSFAEAPHLGGCSAVITWSPSSGLGANPLRPPLPRSRVGRDDPEPWRPPSRGRVVPAAGLRGAGWALHSALRGEAAHGPGGRGPHRPCR